MSMLNAVIISGMSIVSFIIKHTNFLGRNVMLRSVSDRIDGGSPGVCVWEIGQVCQACAFFLGNPSVVGETGYGCHTFYITDVFRNIVIIADIRLLLCLNIVSCAHINMQFVIFTSYEIIYFYS